MFCIHSYFETMTQGFAEVSSAEPSGGISGAAGFDKDGNVVAVVHGSEAIEASQRGFVIPLK